MFGIHLIYLINQIENVHRRYTRRVISLEKFRYLQRLGILEQLELFELSRLCCDLSLSLSLSLFRSIIIKTFKTA